MNKKVIEGLVVTPAAQRPVTEEYVDPDAPAVGRWYWVKGDPEHWNEDMRETWLGCVVHLGSNVATLRGPEHNGWRVHLDSFADYCTPAHDWREHVARKISDAQADVRRLTGEIQEITERLALTNGARALRAGDEPAALALRTGAEPQEYKAALVLAKEKTLPELFAAVKEANERMATWMTVELIPLEAQAEGLQPLLKRINDRIFHVELYAGLVEEIEQIREGTPAPKDTRIHLFQRRAYMDEECLAHYEVGGMDFRNIREFDAWLAKDENFRRLLPMPRSIVAFQVRRHTKERHGVTLSDFLRIIDEERADKMTFLYMRNGDQLFRLSTEINFGAQLFPDQELQHLTGKIYADASWHGVSSLITEGEYLEMVAKHDADEKAKVNSWERTFSRHPSESYSEYSPKHLFYDEITQHLHDKMTAHNRLVIILQGLLDRSPVMHPHPRWQLGTEEGFEAALALVYDGSRAIVPGDAPDFEAYLARINRDIRPGSITVGQERIWVKKEAKRQKAQRGWRYKNFEWPYGNNGPGKVARVHSVNHKKGTATFRWTRKRTSRLTQFDMNYAGKSYEDQLPAAVEVPLTELFHVTGYKPGDFKQFFADPRTRENYLRWAPLLLLAEEYHAGNITLEDDSLHLGSNKWKRGSSWEYRQMLRDEEEDDDE